jgi:hypothetical protein
MIRTGRAVAVWRNGRRVVRTVTEAGGGEVLANLDDDLGLGPAAGPSNKPVNSQSLGGMLLREIVM